MNKQDMTSLRGLTKPSFYSTDKPITGPERKLSHMLVSRFGRMRVRASDQKRAARVNGVTRRMWEGTTQCLLWRIADSTESPHLVFPGFDTGKTHD